METYLFFPSNLLITFMSHEIMGLQTHLLFYEHKNKIKVTPFIHQSKS